MLTDAIGRPLRFYLSPGQAGDVLHAPALLDGQTAQYVLADTAYDSRNLRETIVALGATPVIPSHPTRKHPHHHEPVIYRLRNRIERCFNRLKHHRRIATRFERRAIHYLAFLHLAGALQWCK